MRNFLFFAFLPLCLAIAKPMEPLTNYNVIMVHGAADKYNGFDCYAESAKSAFYIYSGYKDSNDTETFPWKLGDAPGMLGSYENSGKLTHWLDSIIFEDTVSKGSEYIYIQRAFTNPANSPSNNARELGASAWSCNNRRSLIEEAQEVKVEGQQKLRRLRDSLQYDSLPPSRNILIAHSMGGVASREYVQGDFYNDDVDKVITLDSPHEGTGAQNFYIST